MASLMLLNPRRKTRRRKTTRKRRTTRRRNPVAANPRRKRVKRRTTRRRSYRRRNPKMIATFTKDIMPAAIGATGALGLDVAFAALPLPAVMKSGPMGLISKVAGAVVLGMLAKNVTTAANASRITQGALTVIAYGAAKTFLQTSMPGLPLSEYLSGDMDYNADAGYLGYMNAAMTVPGSTDFDFNNAVTASPIYAEDAQMGEYLNEVHGY